MSPTLTDTTAETSIRTSGSAAAAILAAGGGSFALALLTILSDKFVAWRDLLSFYKPTGALSGVTTSAVVIWLAFWIVLDLLWCRKQVSLKWINFVSLLLLLMSLLATFPPLADLL